MQQAALVGPGDGVDHAAEDGDLCFEGGLVQGVGDGQAVDPFHDEAGSAGGGEHLVDLDDAGVVHAGESAGLVHEVVVAGRVVDGAEEQFYGDGAVQQAVVGAVDLAGAAGADLLQDFVSLAEAFIEWLQGVGEVDGSGVGVFAGRGVLAIVFGGLVVPAVPAAAQADEDGFVSHLFMDAFAAGAALAQVGGDRCDGRSFHLAGCVGDQFGFFGADHGFKSSRDQGSSTVAY